MYSHIYIIGRGSTALGCARLLRDRGMAPRFLEHDPGGVSFIGGKLRSLGIARAPFCEAALAEIASRERSLVVSVSNRFIFPRAFVRRANVDIINYHNSLLPRHRGVHAEAWAIYEGDAETGVSWHRIDDGIDTGPVLARRRVPIDDDTTSLSLLRRQSDAAVAAFGDMLPRLLNGAPPGVAQPRDARTEIHFDRERPNDGELDPRWPDDRIWRFLRAFDYGCRHTLGFPRICHDGICYSWKSYAKLPSPLPRRDAGPRLRHIVLKEKFALLNCREIAS